MSLDESSRLIAIGVPQAGCMLLRMLMNCAAMWSHGVGVQSSFVSSGALKGTQPAVAISSKTYARDVRRPLIRQQSIRICGDVEQRNDRGNVVLAGGSLDGYQKTISEPLGLQGMP